MPNDGDGLNFEITAESGVFTSELKRAAAAAKQAAEQITGSLTEASESADKLNTAKTDGFNAEVDGAARVARNAASQISEAIGQAVTATDRMNAVSTAGFRSEMQGAADAATKAVDQIASAEARRAAIQKRFRDQQGPDRNVGSFSNKLTADPDWLQAQPRSIQNAYHAQQKTNNAEMPALPSAGKAAQGIAAAGEAAEHAVPQMAAASASLRLLEGNFDNNIRAAERFLTTTLRLGPILESAFSVVGAIALIGVLAELGSKVNDFFKEMNEAPIKVRDAFASINDSARTSNDALRITNDQLEAQIAKLEHKPENGLKITLDEARESADQLASSLEHDYTAVTNLLKANRVGIVAQTLGKGASSGVESNVENFEDLFRQSGQDLAHATATGDTAGAAKAKAQLDQYQKNALAYIDKEMKERQGTVDDGTGEPGQVKYSSVYGDQTQNLNVLRGFRESVEDNRDAQSLGDQHSALAGKVKTLDGQKAASDAQKKADEERLKTIESGLVQRQLLYGKSVFAEESYWASFTGAFTTGSDQYNTIQKHLEEATKAAGDAEVEVLNKQRERVSGAASEILSMSDLGDKAGRDSGEAVTHTGSGYTQFRAEQFKQEAIPQQSSTAMAEFNLQQAEATGTISRTSAAMQQAALHAKEYAAEVAGLKQELADLPNQALDPKQQQTQQLSIQNQLDSLSGRNAVQVASDNAAIDETSFTASYMKALNGFVEASRETGKEVGDIFTGALGGVNSALATASTEYTRTSRERFRDLRNNLSSGVRNSGDQLAQAGLRRAEGAGLSALGAGGGFKADGSQTNPFWVRIASALGIAGASASDARSRIVDRLAGGSNSPISGGGIFGSLLGVSKHLNPTAGADPLGLNVKQPGVLSDDGTAFGSITQKAITDNSFGSSILRGIASKTGLIAGPALGGLAGMGGSGVSAADSAISGINGLTTDSMFQGAYAAGGDVMADRPALIGEQGPEMFIPKTAGTIIPNHKLGGMGGDSHFHFAPNIDARGSTDPASTKALVNRALVEQAPAMYAAFTKRHADDNKRVPSSKRS